VDESFANLFARDALLQGASKVRPQLTLAPEGRFVLYQYSYAVLSHVRRRFTMVGTRWEWRNLPPAACIAARR